MQLLKILKNKNIKYNFKRFIKMNKLKLRILLLNNKQIEFLTKNFFHLKLQKEMVFSDRFSKAVRLIRLGKYQMGVSEMRSTLLEIQNNYQSFTANENYPALLSHHWATRFGHLGQLAMKIKFDESFRGYEFAQKIYIKDKWLFSKFDKVFGNKITPIYNSNLLDFERPSNWSEFDLMHMLKLNGDFIEHNAMEELFFSTHIVKQSDPLVRVPIERQDLLKRLGLSPSDWFVAIHIRNTNYRFDERQVNQFKFNPALEAVLKYGGKIVQFGLNMTRVQVSDSNKIRYLYDHESAKDLDVSVIAYAKFLLSTSSGPIGIAHALGTPVLQTDCPGICLYCKTASIGSLFLPKRLEKNGVPLKFSELAETGLGYAHINLAEWHHLGVDVIENSATEILEATLEMLNPIKQNSDLDNRLESIRSSYNVVARGQFANSYLEKNSWITN